LSKVSDSDGDTSCVFENTCDEFEDDTDLNTLLIDGVWI
jgi:hypothetical protein